MYIGVGIEGPSKAPVVKQATKVLAELTESVKKLHNPSKGPVTWYSQDQLINDSRRPYNQDGLIMPLVYSTQAGMQVKFSDLKLVFSFIEDISAWEGISVNGINWALTEKTKAKAITLSRTGAVRASAVKALDYAKAAGYSKVRPIFIADPGMLPHISGNDHGSPMPAAYARTSGGADYPQLTFKPQDIKITCAIDAEYEAE